MFLGMIEIVFNHKEYNIPNKVYANNLYNLHFCLK